MDLTKKERMFYAVRTTSRSNPEFTYKRKKRKNKYLVQHAVRFPGDDS